MKVQEIYKRFLIKVNKNDTNSNINVPKGVFVLIFNEQLDFWIENKIREVIQTNEKNKIGNLLVIDKPLTKLSQTANHVKFELPTDFYDIESTYSIASKGTCTNRVLYNFDFKQRNKNVLFQNENEKPSFEYQETLYNINEDGLLVYTDNFTIDSQYLSYFRRPKKIDISGYTKFDGSPSQDIETDIDEKHIIEVINMCSVESVKNFENVEAFQLQKQKTI